LYSGISFLFEDATLSVHREYRHDGCIYLNKTTRAA